MALKIAFVMDPIESINTEKDTTFVLMLDALSRGHEVWYCELSDLMVDRGTPLANCNKVEVFRADPHFKIIKTAALPLENFDCVWMRKDPPFNLDYIYATYILEAIDTEKTFVINKPAGIRSSNEKLYTLNFPELIPPALISKDKQSIKDFMRDVGGKIVIKPLDSCGGEGIFQLAEGEKNINVIIESSTKGGTEFVMAQKFLEEVTEGDKRIILLDGEPIGAVLRVASPEDFRCNFHSGGHPEPTDITERDRHICDKLSRKLKDDGLYFVGIDVIGGLLTEVNTTSPTGVQEINHNLGINIERQVTEFVERMCS